MTTVFIGCSTAAKAQARAIVRAFTRPGLKFLPWWDAFTAGRTLLKDLDHIRGRVDAALLVFSPESAARIRNKRHAVPNLNVLFELGYFYGHFGEKKVAIVKYGEFYLPSDLGGYIHIAGSRSFRRGAAIPIGKRTEREVERWVSAL
ncbi:MAG: TIR domain-containing protein [Gammaproteobacteria bacterium]